MSGRVGICIVIAVPVIFLSSCTKLPEWAAQGEGDIATDTLPQEDSIPAQWGNLVSVTTSPSIAHVFQLWFQDEDGNVRLVSYSARSNSFYTTNVRLFQRGQGGEHDEPVN